MIKKIIIIGLLSVVLFSCEKQYDGEILWGIWNSGKITSDEYAYTIPHFEKFYKVEDGYIDIGKERKYKGSIRDLSENLYITDIYGKYPDYNLKVKLIDNLDENNEESYYGNIKVHFIDKNSMWFENDSSEELNNIFKVRHFSLEFGSNKIFYRAEQMDKPMPRGSKGP